MIVGFSGLPRALVRLGGDRWLVVDSVAERIAASRAGDVLPILEEVETRAEQGAVLVGWIAYEAAPGLDRALRVAESHEPDETAEELICFLVADHWRVVSGGWRPPGRRRRGRRRSQPLWRWQIGVERERYLNDVERIRGAIRRGEVYQVNYTFPLLGGLQRRQDSRESVIIGASQTHLEAAAWRLFRDLQRAQRGEHAAWLDDGRRFVCSASPEMFLELQGDRLASRPMKGTARRGLEATSDRAALEALRSSSKERAENLMIVDMVRNDLARVARPGTVRARELFGLETYPTVHQMVSTVEAETRAGFAEIVRALFPAASITGAPKAASMAEISRLEVARRGIYTGAVGVVGPGRRARFSVAIRTALVGRDGSASYGTGSGVVWDSSPTAEWLECEAKGRNLSYRLPRFRLLETMLWTRSRGFVWLHAHLDRLRDAARYFGFDLDLARVEDQVLALGRQFDEQECGPQMIRLLLAGTGRLELQPRPLALRLRERWRVALAHQDDPPVSSEDRFLRHKTTWRVVYRRALRAAVARHGELEDVLLFNERGRLTESTRANVVLELPHGDRRQLVTPAADHGLLPGVLRGELLRRGRIREATVSREDLAAATGIWLINSVRGCIRVAPIGWSWASGGTVRGREMALEE